MRTLRIRKFMVFGMLSIVMLPWIAYLIVHFLNTGNVQPGAAPNSPQQQANMVQATNLLSTQEPKWSDHSWQQSMRSELKQLQVEVVLLSPTGQEIFKSSPVRQWMPSQEVSVVEGGHVVGIIKFYTRGTNDAVAAATAMIVMILALFFAVGWQIRHNVINPLEAMSRAARKIAEGDLDFQLPKSRVTEIAEVRTAFHTMGEGLRASLVQQTKLEEERRFFIGAIAHDLRTPLFALRGYVEGLERGIASTPEKMAKYVAVCKEKANHLDRLVSDLFAFTKLEYMEQTLQQAEIELADVVQRAVNSVRPLAQEKGVELVIDDPASGCIVSGDAHLLERALNNLLENALRHTPSEGKVFIRWYREAETIKLTVRDTGPGFAPQDMDHLFEPLYRGDPSRNSATGGAGLGLTIAKRIFNAHGGELVASNHADGGAEITGWLPAR